MLGGPRERSGFPPPSGRVTPPLCGLVLLRRSQLDEANERGWTVIDMEQDWTRIYPFVQDDDTR